jgi:SAM-dependent methyltransferase
MTDEFERLIAEAESQRMSGWDWSYVEGRYVEAEPPWNYCEQVRAHLKPAHSLLDMGTGGGELLSSLEPLPRDVRATEGYPPNVPVAQARLAPLGITVAPTIEGEHLPFADASFDVVINRHESFDAHEVRRVLRSGGTFITQQVGAEDVRELNEALQDKVSLACPDWEVSAVRRQIEASGLEVLQAKTAYPEVFFADIGAVVFFLKGTPWQIEDFTCQRYRDRLWQLHQRIQAESGFHAHAHRFFIIARK